jgi:REP element-mobilizing transposase RayT
MPNTYSQIYIHYVFAMHSQDASIDVQWREALYQYIGGIVRKRKQQMIAIGGIHDHVHLIVSMNPNVAPSD